jgi:ribonuclease P protein component
MLPKNRRIERSYFDKILKNSKRYNSTSFVLYVMKNVDGDGVPTKFSFSVSKKVLKSAVKRNKHRRIGYSVIKNNIKDIKPGYYCFFVYKKGFYEEFDSINKDILGLLYSSSVIV